jgi:hypothetical protein
MRTISGVKLLLLVLPLAVAGCGTAPNPVDPGPCDGPSCDDAAPPESVCLDHLAADEVIDGCGVFLSHFLLAARRPNPAPPDDSNPGTMSKPVKTLKRAIELARVGRGRVFACGQEAWEDPITLPSGVDLWGNRACLNKWERQIDEEFSTRQFSRIGIAAGKGIALTIEPASEGDTGAADGISKIYGWRIRSGNAIGVLVRSGAAVEFDRSEIEGDYGWKGRDGEDAPDQRAPDGNHGNYGSAACSAAIVTGGVPMPSPCGDGAGTIGGKGGDGYTADAGAGENGSPQPLKNPTYSGNGGHGDPGDGRCQNGFAGLTGEVGANGPPGEGIGRVTETGWEGGKAGDGSPGAPGGGGGGGGGRRGGLALCGSPSLGGASGGAGGAGGCGGQGGKGGENADPSIGILALHAKVTVRDSTIVASGGGNGGDGGRPQRGGEPGRGAPGGTLPDGSAQACYGGEGGLGARGGWGGGGRGGDSIGIAYLDEDQLFLENVVFTLGKAGKGGFSGDLKSGADGAVYEKFRFPE